MIELISKEKCSGCSACLNACIVNAISLIEDETGFCFPVIDREKCINCGKCMDACPAINLHIYKSTEPKAYIVQNLNDEELMQSTSGGAFTGVAKWTLDRSGIVFGATLDDVFNVKHICVEDEKDLILFRGSKYVQSQIGYTFREVKDYLLSGREVLFSGTPCQIAGLKNFLGEDYKNLLTVDVMCHSVPSPKVFKKYISYLKDLKLDFNRINFRDKGRGYLYSTMTLYKDDLVVYREGSEADPWLRLFLGGFCNRDICHNCIYQTGTHASDLTMWDCWWPQEYDGEWNDKGTTYVIAWTEKGKRSISEGNYIKRMEIELKSINDVLKRHSIEKPNYDRKQFFKDCEALGSIDFVKKYVPYSFGVRIKRIARIIMFKLRVHDPIKYLVYKLK